MHKAFINNKPLIFDDVYRVESGNIGGYLVLSDSEFTVDEVVKRIESEKLSGIIYLSANPDQSWTTFTGRYILMEAAGGIVSNGKGEILTIYRKKHWDLPKGKLEYRESPENAAVREVQEECGIKKIELNNFLLKTFHTYSEKNKFILKKTHWYTMTTSDEKLIPQKEEDIEKAEWMNIEMIYSTFFKKTYLSITDVLSKYFSQV